MNASTLGSWSSCCSALVWSLAMASSLQLSQADNLTWWPTFWEPWVSLCSSKIKKSWMYLWVKFMKLTLWGTGLCVSEKQSSNESMGKVSQFHFVRSRATCVQERKLEGIHAMLSWWISLVTNWVMCGMHAVLSVISGIGVAAPHQYQGEYH